MEKRQAAYFGLRLPRMALLDPLPDYRARIGLIFPSIALGGSDWEYWALFPEGVFPLITRVMLAGAQVTPRALIRMGEEVEHAAAMLKTARCDVVSYACTSGSFIKGPAWDEETIQMIERVSGAKATSMANGVLKAFRALNAEKVIMAAPYIESIIETELKYFGDQGIEFLYHEGLGLADAYELCSRLPYENYQFAYEVWMRAPAKAREEADLLFITCGGMRTIEIIERLEQQIGVPVVSSNQCNAWHCLKLAGIEEPLYGVGKLMQIPR